MLQADGHFTVIGECGDGVSLINLVLTESPDVVLMDISMPEMSGLVAIDKILAQRPMTRILVLSMHNEREYMEAMREAGAKGTGDRLTNAFGMQFNPEIPDDRADTITAYLKAFLCLYDWLAERTEVNLARRIPTYVDPFPAAYVKRVTTPEYWPDQARLIDDYLEHNPTRNRALDMLPLFRHLDEQRVLARAPDPLIKARPTFHYRLPDCRIDEPGWDMTPAWNDWLQIERLACDRERLQRCCEAYQQWLHQGLGRLLESWPRQVERDWLSRDAQ